MDSGYNIVVVDDEKIILDIFREYLESSTVHRIFTTTDGYEALDIIRQGDIDCCFTDISMPNMDGVELTKRIHELDNSIPVVVMTGYPSLENAVDTLKNGVSDFLTKPIKMDKVIFTIDRIMRERTLLADNFLLKEQAQKNKELLKINLELQQKIKEVEIMNLILQKLDQATNSKDLFDVLVNLSSEITGCSESHFCIFTEQMKDYAIITSYHRDNNRHSYPASASIDKKAVTKVAAEGIPILIKGNSRNPSTMVIPLKIRSKVFGILILSHGKEKGQGQFTEKDLFFMNFLAGKASYLIENLALYENITENLFSTLYALVDTIEARDPYTRQHSARVSGYATLMAESMGCSQEEIEKLNISGNLHDIGKIGVPDSILLKKGKLNFEEYEVIKTHPTIGANIISRFGMWTDEQFIIKHHHERFDGTGYPEGLKGNDIPFLSRILSIADAFDALTSDRSYRKRMSDEMAVSIIKANKWEQFDPKIVNIFLALYKQGKLNTFT